MLCSGLIQLVHENCFFFFYNACFLIEWCKHIMWQLSWVDVTSHIALKCLISSWRTTIRIFSSFRRAPPMSRRSKECASASSKMMFWRPSARTRPRAGAPAYRHRHPHRRRRREKESSTGLEENKVLLLVLLCKI